MVCCDNLRLSQSLHFKLNYIRIDVQNEWIPSSVCTWLMEIITYILDNEYLEIIHICFMVIVTGMKSSIFFVAIFYTATSLGQQAEKLVQNPCVSKTKCNECIQTPSCAWCFDPVSYIYVFFLKFNIVN